MAHYAFLNDENKVIEVIVGIDESEKIEGVTPEIWYGNFRNLKCRRTSYNAKIRGKFAAIGDSYDEVNDIFVSPQPHASWTQNGSYWTPPKPYPDVSKFFQWDEEILDWVEIG